MGCFSLFGQNEFRTKHYTYYDGLASDWVNFTCTSQKGFLFISTQRGLSVFDGYRFIDSEQSNQKIVSQFVKNDTLYFEDNESLKKVSLDKLGSTPITITSKIPSDSDPNNDHFDNLFIDSKNRIWCSDFDHIKYSEKGNEFKSFEIFSDNRKNIRTVSFLEISQNEIWIAATNGLWVWKNDKVKKHSNSLLSDNFYTGSYKLNNSFLLLATSDEIIIWNIKENKLENSIPNPENPIFHITEVNGEIFVCTKNLVYRLNRSTSELHLFYTSEHKINHLFFDEKTNIFWISTTNGLNKLILPKKGIETFLFDENSTITSISESSNGIYTITDFGTIWKLNNGKWKKIELGFPVKAQSVNTIENRIFVGTDNGILEIKNDIPNWILLDNFPKGKIVRKILLTSDNEFWIVFDKERIHRYRFGSFEFLSNNFSNNSSFWDDNLWNDALVDKNGTIWLVGWMPKGYGITKYDPKKNEFIDISDKNINSDKGLFVGDYYNFAYETKNNGLLFSAYGGWNRTDYNGKITQRIDIHSSDIQGIYLNGISEHHNQNVFFVTEEGLHIYRKNLDKVVRLTKADGLPVNYLTNAYFVLKNGNIALGIPNGMTLINPNLVMESELTDRTEISYLTINGKIRFLEDNSFELSKKENNLSVYFSDLSYLDNFKVSHRYKINNEKWIDLGHHSELSFNNLNPGNYNITVETYDHLGNTQQKNLQIHFKAHPPFTKSTLFYVLIGLLISSIVIFVNWYLLKRKQKEDEFLRRIKEAEMESLRSQMNPHFMFNTLNSINSFIIQNKTKDASKYLTSFSKLMRNILDNSKYKFISLEKEIQTLKLYIELESARLEHFFDYTVSIDKNVNTDSTMIPPLVIQPFVENAIWHGLRSKKQDGLISIHISFSDDKALIINIEDNGIGREKSASLKTNRTSHKSYGIDITKERLKMVNAENEVKIIDLYDNQNNPLGTKVVVTLKTNEDD